MNMKKIVDRFLSWKLPYDFSPDCFISFDKERAELTPSSWPVGTNLLNYDQAMEMVKFILNDISWISVKDRLPEPDQWIIYHAPDIFEEGPHMWIGKYEDGVFFGRSGFFGGGEVTHWMPLPELP